MAARTILLLGDERLYERSCEVEQRELPGLRVAIEDLHHTMLEFQRVHGWGRAIAAPQIGVAKRIVAMNVDASLTFINPVLEPIGDEQLEYWEDCMSFPELVVRIATPRRCKMRFRDLDWVEREVLLSDDFAALLQHEVDHLDGVLAVQRALDDRAIALRATRPEKDLSLRGEFEFVTGALD